MRAIVKAAVQRELGIALIPVNDELAFHMSGRVMVSTLPKEFKDAPEGILPKVQHEIANDPRLQTFFQHERVTKVCGGVNAIEDWASQFTKCQYKKHDHPPTILDTVRVHHSAVRICPGCFTLSAGASPNLMKLAARNTARWVVATAKHRIRSEGQMTIPELLLWAMLSGVFDLIPEEVARTVTDIPAPKVITGTRKESDMDCMPAVTEIIAKKAVKCFTVDPEPPKAFMLRPKLTRVEDSKYTRWVKTQPCCGCGARADDPHHIIGHGMGGMGTKPSDYLTIPLCRTCHRSLHDNPTVWEAEHGSQTDLLAQSSTTRSVWGRFHEEVPDHPNTKATHDTKRPVGQAPASTPLSGILRRRASNKDLGRSRPNNYRGNSMRLESIPKYFAPKSPTFSDSPRATASDSLTGTDVMAAFGMCQAQAEFGLDLFLAKQGISSPERALERLKEYSIKAAGAHKAICKHSEAIQNRAIGVMVAFAFQDYSRSAASVRTCECCKGEGFIDAEVFTNKVQYPDGKPPKWAKITKGVFPSYWEEVKSVREVVKVLCPTCKGKKVISNACRCHGRGKVLDKKLSDKTGIPVMKDCDKCSGRGYARLPAEQVRKALALEGLEIAETTWRRDYKPFYEQLVTQCHKEESIADSMLATVTV